MKLEFRTNESELTIVDTQTGRAVAYVEKGEDAERVGMLLAAAPDLLNNAIDVLEAGSPARAIDGLRRAVLKARGWRGLE